MFRMKTRVCLNYFVNECLCKQFFASNSSQTPSNLILLTIFVTLSPLTLFQPKTRATNLQKALKFVLLDKYFPDIFTEVQISFWKLFTFGLGSFFRKAK